MLLCRPPPGWKGRVSSAFCNAAASTPSSCAARRTVSAADAVTPRNGVGARDGVCARDGVGAREGVLGRDPRGGGRVGLIGLERVASATMILMPRRMANICSRVSAPTPSASSAATTSSSFSRSSGSSRYLRMWNVEGAVTRARSRRKVEMNAPHAAPLGEKWTCG